MIQFLYLVAAQQVSTESLDKAGQDFISRITNNKDEAPQAQKDFAQAQANWATENAKAAGVSVSSINNGDPPLPAEDIQQAQDTPEDQPSPQAAPAAQQPEAEAPAQSPTTTTASATSSTDSTTSPSETETQSGSSTTNESSGNINTAAILIFAVFMQQ